MGSWSIRRTLYHTVLLLNAFFLFVLYLIFVAIIGFVDRVHVGMVHISEYRFDRYRKRRASTQRTDVISVDPVQNAVLVELVAAVEAENVAPDAHLAQTDRAIVGFGDLCFPHDAMEFATHHNLLHMTPREGDTR